MTLAHRFARSGSTHDISIRREPNPDDARSVHVTLSPLGVEAFVVGTTETAGMLSALTDEVTSAEAERLTRLLDRMLEHRGL